MPGLYVSKEQQLQTSDAHRGIQPPTVLYLFGPPGSGKSYLGKLLACELTCDFIDADDWLPEDMHLALQKGRGFSQEQRDRYYMLIAERLLERTRDSASSLPVVVAQATIKNRHRHLLLKSVPGICMCWVRAPPEVCVQRLSIGRNLVSSTLGSSMAREFEVPDHDHVSIFNDSSAVAGVQPSSTVDHQLLAQCQKLIRQVGLSHSCV
mmetsp:Transcript_28307/g.61969  ORF Transcript_28307/g.61969 Transcript_28307/m.61969 type:complete len:208 (-) Transcript_28307:193-816(-)